MPLGCLATSPPQRSTTPPRRLSTLTTAPSRLCSLRSSTPRHLPLPPLQSSIQQPTHATSQLYKEQMDLLEAAGSKDRLALSVSCRLDHCVFAQCSSGSKEGGVDLRMRSLWRGRREGRGKGAGSRRYILVVMAWGMETNI